MHVWGLDNFWDLILSFHYMGSREQAQVLRLGKKESLATEHLCFLIFFFKCIIVKNKFSFARVCWPGLLIIPFKYRADSIWRKYASIYLVLIISLGTPSVCIQMVLFVCSTSCFELQTFLLHSPQCWDVLGGTILTGKFLSNLPFPSAYERVLHCIQSLSALP